MIAWNKDIAWPTDRNSQVNVTATYTGVLIAVSSAVPAGSPTHTYLVEVWPTTILALAVRRRDQDARNQRSRQKYQWTLHDVTASGKPVMKISNSVANLHCASDEHLR